MFSSLLGFVLKVTIGGLIVITNTQTISVYISDDMECIYIGFCLFDLKLH